MITPMKSLKDKHNEQREIEKKEAEKRGRKKKDDKKEQKKRVKVGRRIKNIFKSNK